MKQKQCQYYVLNQKKGETPDYIFPFKRGLKCLECGGKLYSFSRKETSAHIPVESWPCQKDYRDMGKL